MTHPTNAPPVTTGQVVFGLQIEDDSNRILVKRVLTLSIIGAAFVIINGIIGVAKGIDGEDSEGVINACVGIVIGMLIPACGWFGAKDSSSQLMCCFCGCNLYSAFWEVVGVFALILINALDVETDGDVRLERAKMSGGLVFLVALISVVALTVHCMSFWFGNKLYATINGGVMLHQPVLQGVPVIQQQPQMMGQAQMMGVNQQPQMMGVQHQPQMMGVHQQPQMIVNQQPQMGYQPPMFQPQVVQHQGNPITQY